MEKFNLKPVEIPVLRPLAPALYVIAQLPDSAGDPGWTIDELRNPLTGTPSAYEGIYIEIQSANGNSLLAAATAYEPG